MKLKLKNDQTYFDELKQRINKAGSVSFDSQAVQVILSETSILDTAHSNVN